MVHMAKGIFMICTNFNIFVSFQVYFTNIILTFRRHFVESFKKISFRSAHKYIPKHDSHIIHSLHLT